VERYLSVELMRQGNATMERQELRFNQRPSRAVAHVLAAALSIGVIACQAKSGEDASPKAAADIMSVSLASSEHFTFYFVSRTEDWVYDRAALKRESSIRFYRACGANCANTLGKVVDHLAHAKSTKCEPGQENVLLEIGSTDHVIYSNSGRMIHYRGACYYNPVGVVDAYRQAELGPYSGLDSQRSPGKRSAPGVLHTETPRSPGVVFGITRITGARSPLIAFNGRLP
jgi:hypothetical protein